MQTGDFLRTTGRSVAFISGCLRGLYDMNDETCCPRCCTCSRRRNHLNRNRATTFTAELATHSAPVCDSGQPVAGWNRSASRFRHDPALQSAAQGKWPDKHCVASTKSTGGGLPQSRPRECYARNPLVLASSEMWSGIEWVARGLDS